MLKNLLSFIVVATLSALPSVAEDNPCRGNVLYANAECVKYTYKKAKEGYAGAQYNFGLMYYKGGGVERDYREAARWYRLAAEQGLTQAQFALGLSYAQGEGVVRDYREAVRWYRLAAEYGHADAQSNLGQMYYEGTGVIRDYYESLIWALIASASGSENMDTPLSLLATKLTPRQTQSAEQEAKQRFSEIEKRRNAVKKSN